MLIGPNQGHRLECAPGYGPTAICLATQRLRRDCVAQPARWLQSERPHHAALHRRQLVYDPSTNTAFVKPDEILESDRPYLIENPGAPIFYARHLKSATLRGNGVKRIRFQMAWGDQTGR